MLEQLDDSNARSYLLREQTTERLSRIWRRIEKLVARTQLEGEGDEENTQGGGKGRDGRIEKDRARQS